jgi:hypothetical protein
MQVALSVGVQKMVRSDIAGSGASFTIDTDLKKEQVRNDPEFDPFLFVERGQEHLVYEKKK